MQDEFQVTGVFANLARFFDVVVVKTNHLYGIMGYLV